MPDIQGVRALRQRFHKITTSLQPEQHNKISFLNVEATEAQTSVSLLDDCSFIVCMMDKATVVLSGEPHLCANGIQQVCKVGAHAAGLVDKRRPPAALAVALVEGVPEARLLHQPVHNSPQNFLTLLYHAAFSFPIPGSQAVSSSFPWAAAHRDPVLRILVRAEQTRSKLKMCVGALKGD